MASKRRLRKRSCTYKKKYKCQNIALGELHLLSKTTGINKRSLVVYKCSFCGCWHVGKKSKYTQNKIHLKTINKRKHDKEVRKDEHEMGFEINNIKEKILEINKLNIKELKKDLMKKTKSGESVCILQKSRMVRIHQVILNNLLCLYEYNKNYEHTERVKIIKIEILA